jgi:hypothetical protein
MFPDQIKGNGTNALELRERLIELRAERTTAMTTDLAKVDAYMSDLDEEIESTRRLYVASAVFEIAALRAELSGPQTG